MKTATLQRALTAVREKIKTADRKATDWLIERDRRRRQEAAILRGILRAEGSQVKAASATGISVRTIMRTVNPQGHEMHRKDDTERRAVARSASFQKLADPPENVVPLRKRRPDWKPREPRLSEIDKWVQQYRNWSRTAQQTARQILFSSVGALPNDAYYPADNPGPVSASAVGEESRAG